MKNVKLSFLESIINTVADPIFVKDNQHRWVIVNDAFCAFLNLKHDEIVGKSDYDFFPKEEADIFWEKDRLVFETKKENINEENITLADGQILTITTKKRIFEYEGQLFLVGVINDITEKKNLIEAYQNSNKLLQNYAHMSSHDLRSPLRTLKSFSQLLSRSASSKLNNEELEYLQFIEKGAESMNDLIQKILEHSKLATINSVYSKHIFSEIVGELEMEMKADIESAGCKLMYDQAPSVIFCDRVRLKQILQNLISNSIKFRRKDIDLVIQISCNQDSKFHTITVKDNGIGFHSKYKDEVFKMFKKLHNQEEYQGSGLGLSICKEIAKQHGGEMWAESVEDEGSSISFTISQTAQNNAQYA